MIDEVRSHKHDTWGNERYARVLYNVSDTTITNYMDFTGLQSNKHYRMYWAGWLDNGPNTVDNYFYLAFGNAALGFIVSADRYAEVRYQWGGLSLSEVSTNPAGVGIRFGRSIFGRDTYFSFSVDIFTGDNIGYRATGQIQVLGSMRDSASALGVLLSTGGLREGLGISDIDRIRIGISLTGAGYSAQSWIRLLALP